MTAVMPDDQYSNHFVVNKAKQNRVWETLNKRAANATFDDRIPKRVGQNSRNGRVDFGSKLVAEASTVLVIECDGVIEIGCSERLILNPHSGSPPVRRKN